MNNLKNIKNFIKSNKYLVVITLFLIVSVFVILLNKNNSYEVKKSFIKNDISFANQITCTYPQVVMAIYNNGEISHTLPEPEISPMIFTFSEINEPQNSKLSYIDSTRTITNTQLLKIVDNNEKIVFLEGNGEDYLTVHSIYKKSGVSTYSKNINFFDMIPEVASGMGTCVGY